MNTNSVPSENVAINIQDGHNNEIHLVQHFCDAVVTAISGNDLKKR